MSKPDLRDMSPQPLPRRAWVLPALIVGVMLAVFAAALLWLEAILPPAPPVGQRISDAEGYLRREQIRAWQYERAELDR